jgi:hypothetical protein
MNRAIRRREAEKKENGKGENKERENISFQPHYGPGFDSASNRNEYQESSWG